MSQFADRMVEILNHGALNLALAIGYKHKIFDVMEELDRPVTISVLAGSSNLDKRYLQEWLGIMVTGRIIEISENRDKDTTYFLPPDHAAVLTRKAGNKNLGVYAQEIPLLTAIAMDGVQKGFTTGRGIPFSAYENFQDFMSQLSTAKHEQVLIKDFLPSVDNGRLVQRLKTGIRVCDIGCGQGVALTLMARAFPESSFVGIDSHEPAICKACASAQDLSNLKFQTIDAATIKESPNFCKKFDYVLAFDAIHDQSHPLKTLEGIFYMMAPGGLFSMIDIKANTRHQDNLDHPMAPFLYTVSLMHCMPVGMNDKGTGLGMMWGKEQAFALLGQAGFKSIKALDIPNDDFNLHYLCQID